MANNYIYKVKLPSGNEYLIKDLQARQQIAAITGQTALIFKGVTTTNLTDGATTTTVLINGSNVTFTSNDTGSIVIYKPTNTNQPPREFIWDGSHWQLFGSAKGILGDLAYASTASASYTPGATVTLQKENTAPTISSAAGAASDNTFSTIGSVALKTGNKTATISVGSVSSANPVNYTPAGSVSIATTGDKATTVSTVSGDATYTPAGSITVTLSSSAQGTTTIKHVKAVNNAIKTLAVTNAGTSVANTNTDLVYCGVEIPSGEEDGVLVLNHVSYTSGATIATEDKAVTTNSASYSINAAKTSFTGTGVRLKTAQISVPTSFEFNGTGVRLVNSAIAVPTAIGTTATYIKLANNGIALPTGITYNGTPATITVNPVTS